MKRVLLAAAAAIGMVSYAQAQTLDGDEFRRGGAS